MKNISLGLFSDLRSISSARMFADGITESFRKKTKTEAIKVIANTGDVIFIRLNPPERIAMVSLYFVNMAIVKKDVNKRDNGMI